MKTVLYVNYYASPVSMRFLDGVFRYAHEAKWNVQVADKVSENALKKLAAFWNPVGCIYGANDGIKPKLVKAISDRPLVFMDCDQDFSCPGAGKVCSDAESVAGMAVRGGDSAGISSEAEDRATQWSGEGWRLGAFVAFIWSFAICWGRPRISS